MKRLSLFFIISFSLFSCHSLFAECSDTSLNALDFLKGCASGTNGVPLPTSEGVTGVRELVITIVERLLQYGALFAIAFIVIAGIKYTTAYGDDEKIKSAKNTIIYAIGGLILMLVAFPFVSIIVNFIYSLTS